MIERTVEQLDNHTLDHATVDRLASLSPFEYDRLRKAEERRLEIQVRTLDQAVAARRARCAEGRTLVEELEPWPEPVSGHELFAALMSAFGTYVTMGAPYRVAAALWVIGTYCIDAFPLFPKLLLTSPEKRCGKTTCLDVVEATCHKSLYATNITPAALFRSVDAWRLTLLLDEADAWMRDNEELRGLVNAGHRKRSAFVVRTVGDEHTPKQFSVWAPMAIAAIGRLPGTIEDRSVVIRLERATERGPRVPTNYFEQCAYIRAQALRWAQDHMASLEELIEAPRIGNDRAEDNWSVLLTIARELGPEELEAARGAFAAMHRDAADDDSIGAMLLADIRAIFDERGADRISSEELLRRLNEMDDRPWPTWSRGKNMNPHTLAGRLKPYGIRSTTVRFGTAPNDRAKGFHRGQFEDAFARYIPQKSVTPCQPSTNAASSEPTKGDGRDVSRIHASLEPAKTLAWHDVTEIRPLSGEGAQAQETTVKSRIWEAISDLGIDLQTAFDEFSSLDHELIHRGEMTKDAIRHFCRVTFGGLN